MLSPKQKYKFLWIPMDSYGIPVDVLMRIVKKQMLYSIYVLTLLISELKDSLRFTPTNVRQRPHLSLGNEPNAAAPSSSSAGQLVVPPPPPPGQTVVVPNARGSRSSMQTEGFRTTYGRPSSRPTSTRPGRPTPYAEPMMIYVP